MGDQKSKSFKKQEPPSYKALEKLILECIQTSCPALWQKVNNWLFNCKHDASCCDVLHLKKPVADWFKKLLDIEELKNFSQLFISHQPSFFPDQRNPLFCFKMY